MNGSDRLKIAVFIDFDNIEIGVKSTLGRHFDVGTVLEAIKERGEVVTKIAYGDWKRAGEHSRGMTQHAIQMVQRNLTPGGDKNGADINLALDALEMAFTRNHINAFVIVGGDSDFMALVEKLKQYDKKVIVVGGRAFTSVILQKNCHEFIAYENLISHSATPRRPTERARAAGGSAPVSGDANLSRALPLVQRALKVLSDREVSPQLGLLKSTLLQLDSTFTERDYGAGTFRDFIEKMAAAGYVHLKQVDRSLLVELKDEHKDAIIQTEAPSGEVEDLPQSAADLPASAVAGPSANGAPSSAATPTQTPEQIEEGIRAMSEIFQTAKNPPHWPMYIRNVKQYMKNAAPTFDERQYGFANFLEAVRACGRSGLFRLERNRQGILRVFAGSQYQHSPAAGRAVVETKPPIFDIEDELRAEAEARKAAMEARAAAAAESESASDDFQPNDEETSVEVSQEEEAPAPKRRARPAGTSAKKKPAAPRKTKKKAAESDNAEDESQPF